MSAPTISASTSLAPIPYSLETDQEIDVFLNKLKPLALEYKAFTLFSDLVLNKKVTPIYPDQIKPRTFFTHLMGMRILNPSKGDTYSLPFILNLHFTNPDLFENPDLKTMGFNPIFQFSIQDLDNIFYLNNPCLNRFFDIPPKLCEIMVPLLQLLNDPEPTPVSDQEIKESFQYILDHCNHYGPRFLEAFMIEDSFMDFFLREPRFLSELFKIAPNFKEMIRQKIDSHPHLVLKPLKTGKISLFFHLAQDPFSMILDALDQIDGFSLSSFQSKALLYLLQQTTLKNVIRFLYLGFMDENSPILALGLQIRQIGPMHAQFVDLVGALHLQDSLSVGQVLESSLNLETPELFLNELSQSKELSQALLKDYPAEVFRFTGKIFKRETLSRSAPFFLSSFHFLSPDNKYFLIRHCGRCVDPLQKNPFDQKVKFVLKNIVSQAKTITQSNSPSPSPCEKRGVNLEDSSDLDGVEISSKKGIVKNPDSQKPFKISKSTAFYLFDIKEAVSFLTDNDENYKLGLFYFWNSLEMKKAILGLYPFLEPAQKAAILPFLEVCDFETIEIGDKSFNWIHFLTNLRSDMKSELILGRKKLFFSKIATKERELLSKYDLARPPSEYFQNIPPIERKKWLESIHRFLKETRDFKQDPLVKEMDKTYRGILSTYVTEIERQLELVEAILEKRYPQLV
jgi:hypothetical protein